MTDPLYLVASYRIAVVQSEFNGSCCQRRFFDTMLKMTIGDQWGTRDFRERGGRGGGEGGGGGGEREKPKIKQIVEKIC